MPTLDIPWFPASAPLCYLGSPFTNYPHGHHRAVIDIARIAAQLLSSGVRLFCPVVHSAPLVWIDDSPLDPNDGKLWADINAPFLRVCDLLIVAQLDGWEESGGLKAEIAAFEQARIKDIWDLDPKTLVMRRRKASRLQSGIMHSSIFQTGT